MTVYISPETGKKIVRLVLACFLVILVFIFYVFWVSYEGRQDLVNVERAACGRAKMDRMANAKGWRELAKESWDTPIFSQIADELEERSEIDCVEAFPDADILP